MLPLDVAVIGSYVQDHAWLTQSFPCDGESRLATGFSTGPGGKGFNQAVACHRQGVKTCFIGAIGNDALGENAQRFARDDKLPVQFDVRVGDRIVTAGVDGIFPRGVPVGEVVSVEADQGIFHRIVVQPAVDLGALETVQVLSRAAIPEEVRQQLGLLAPAPGAP